FNTSNPINNATIEILTTTNTASSDINGDYAIGILTAGTYDIAFSAAGYIPDTLTAILSNGVLTVVNAQLVELIPFAISGQVIESGSGNPVPNASVKLESNDFLFNLTADGGGNFSIPVFFEGNYEVIAGKWNYITNCFNQYIDSNTSAILIELDSGIYDDFTFDFNWSVSGNASTGIWERGEPVGTDWFTTGDANPGVDVSTDCSNQAYVTGNAGGGVGNDDVDNGNTVLTSPVFDLSSYTEPYISYYRWFFNDGGSGIPNDTLKVRLTNGVSTVMIETVNEGSPNNSSWVYRSFRISDYITPTSTMQMTLETSDLSGSGHLVEAGVDKFQVTEELAVVINPTNVTCNGGCDGVAAASVNGGAQPLAYFWDDSFNQTTSTATGLCSGTYTITVVDANNDTAYATIIIGEPALLTVDSATSTLASCSGADGSITIYVSGGTPPLEFTIDSGNTFQSSNTFGSLAAGIYSIIILDLLNCTTNTIATVSNAGAPAIMVDSVADVGCNGGNDGIIYVSSTGGNPAYQYSINGGVFQADSTFTGLTEGNYLLTVKDASSCESSILQYVSEPTALVFAIDSITNVKCNGISDGIIYTSAAGGTSPYDFSMDNGVSYQSNSMFSGLSALSYNIIARDANGCTDTIFNQTISEPDSLAGMMSSTDESSSGANDGTASVLMSGGTGPYTYSWSPGSQTTPSISGLTSDVYTVTVTDTNGCTFVDSISVSTLISIDEFIRENATIKVYPNPFNESTQIEYKLDENISTGAKILITDLLGRSVIEIALTSREGIVTIDDEISEGVYFVRIINGKKFSHTVKLIKF
ncbi:carboxypeptidase regulatory-like domain-containing protein, partial [bacterium AH-315-M05]|nr:carboxypeptidase regulatory-like domain-containing protein [bacterium AH-315-M05]